MIGQQSEAGWRRRCDDDDDDADEEALEWEFSERWAQIDGELEAAGMRRMIFDEPEALAAPRGSVQRVFKEQNRGKESFKIKCWAAADLQWVGGQWSGLVLPEYNEFRIYLQYKCFSFFCIYFFLNTIISIQQPFGEKKDKLHNEAAKVWLKVQEEGRSFLWGKERVRGSPASQVWWMRRERFLVTPSDGFTPSTRSTPMNSSPSHAVEDVIETVQAISAEGQRWTWTLD